MFRFFVVSLSVSLFIATAANFPAYQADPQVAIRTTNTACIFDILWRGTTTTETSKTAVLCVAANWTATASPFLQTCAVEDVLTQNDE
jgi:hypothetical protein